MPRSFFMTHAPHPVLMTDSGKHRLTPISSDNRYTLSSVFTQNFAVEGENSISRINFKTTLPMLKIQCSSQDRQKKIQTSPIPRQSVTSNLILLMDYEIISQENSTVPSLSLKPGGDIGDKQGK